MSTREIEPAAVAVGQVYVGWGKRWCIVEIRNGTGKAVNCADRANTIRLPLEQFRDWSRQ